MKTPDKMVKYLKKLEGLGLRQVRVIVPAEDEHRIAEAAEALRLDYLHKVARTADYDDTRLKELAESRLSTAVNANQIAEWRNALPSSQHILFDKKVLTMQQEWGNMVSAVQSKHSATMRGDDQDARRYAAIAAVFAMAYRAAKDDLTHYVAAQTL